MNAERYASLEQLKEHLSIPDADTGQDTLLSLALAAASSLIEAHCGRTFNPAGATPSVQTRYYTADRTRGVVFTADIASSSSIVIRTDDGTQTWSTTLAGDEYALEPRDAVSLGVPFERIYSDNWPADVRDGVEVTAILGWPAIPDNVIQGVLLQASRIYSRKDSPYGIAGSPENGEVRLLARLDPDVKLLLLGLRKMVVE